MARLAHNTYQADFVINNDADEFWTTQNGRSLKDYFTDYLPSKYNKFIGQRKNMIALKSFQNKSKHNFTETMIFKDNFSKNPLGNPLPHKVSHRSNSLIEITQGNHDARFPENASSACPETLDVLHFPLRTKTQYTNKIRLGGSAYQRNSTLPKNAGATWREQYKQLIKTGNLNQFFEKAFITNRQVVRGLITKEFEIDERVKNFFA